MNTLKFIFVILLLGAGSTVAEAQHASALTQEALRFPREKMTFEDDQLILFNGRGFVSPREFGMTSFTNVQFQPLNLAGAYDFYINMLEEEAKLVIRDDVATQWKAWCDEMTGWDPLGANFRAYAPKVLVTQDEEWRPNLYTRTGIFNKELEGRWINFGMKTATCVSATDDEVLLKIEMHNRDKALLKLTLMPSHIAKTLSCGGQSGTTDIKVNTPFKLASEQVQINVSSDIPTYNEKGYQIEIPAGEVRTFYFTIRFTVGTAADPSVCIAHLSERFEQAQAKIQQTLQWASDRLPQVNTENKRINALYYRSLLSVLLCRHERENYIIKPFWTVGTWPFTISWDNSYASDILAMLEPASLKETLRLNFTAGQMKRTYIGWNGGAWDMLYIQEPFAQQIMLDAYMNQTGDESILNEMAGDATLYEWMTRWAAELHDKYGRKDGLIDVGYSTEKIIEIRTDGYNHVVPIVNGLTADLYTKLACWAEKLDKKSDVRKYKAWADQLRVVMNEKLWNPDKKWFDNLYADGSKGTVLTYHLFDLLNSSNISGEQRLGLMSHIRENVFLGEFGFYSIARNDSTHWDRIDGDWGGGGQYAGMPSRIARNLYTIGNAQLGWEVLRRYAKYVDYFPYLTQNPSTDKPKQDRSSMPLQISAGAAAEALLFGTFGIKAEVKRLSFTPNYHAELGCCTVKNYRWQNNVYDMELIDKLFRVYQNGKLIGEKPYGETIIADIR